MGSEMCIRDRFHIVNALATKAIRKTGDVPPHDELDRIIELKAAKLSGTVLAVAVIAWCIAATTGVLGGSEIANNVALNEPITESKMMVSVLVVLTAVHMLFAGFVIANIAYYGSIVVGYRSLARG